ncbi:MAG TPA: sugar transferase [Candidatus Sulfotelmatobacter sp.]|jgi:exopolysaccharide biosynthesis polyprenyl glycosylphosphotransferase|nr:sugar transferase [Candidatus Sulfotelmatobacter sp.]
MRIGRKVFSNGFKLFDLLLMMVSFAVATLPLYERVGRFSLAQFFELRVKLGNLILFLSFLLIWHLVFRAFGLYASKRLTSRWEELFDITKATTIGTAIIAICGWAFHIWIVNRVFLGLFWLATTILVVLSRTMIRSSLAYARRHGRNTRNMLVIGTNSRALQLVDRIQHKPELGYRILGFADEDWTGIDEFKKQGLPLVSDLEALPSYVRRNVVDEVVLALPIRSFHTFASQIAAACEQQGIIVRFLPNIFDLKEARHSTDELDGDPLISHDTTITDFWGLTVKRAIDIVVSLTAIVLLSPVMILTAILVKLTSPGPVFFMQKRLGLNKRMFHIFKFRTMVVDAEARLKDLEHKNEANGPVFKIKKDPRITSIGTFLRKTSIDELPQLFNVLKGEMSLVGPRPLQVRDYELFETFCGDWQRKRFSVRPGITCLWQIKGRSSTTFERWMELDLQYIRTWSLWLDLEILAKTVPAVLKGSGAA